MNRAVVNIFGIILTISLYVCPLLWGNSPVFARSSEIGDLYLEAQWVAYYTNLQRRAHGLAPLKLSRELTTAALSFSQDVVENLGGSYCGHTDSLQRSVRDRIRASGMLGAHEVGENVGCGMVNAQDVVTAWMASEGHRDNILHSSFTEIGVGYYRKGSTGFVAQDFAYDPASALLVINDEAPSTNMPEVELYIYDHVQRGGMTGMGPATEMMISNRADFEGAEWEAFSQEKSWTLEDGEGWRTVYVKTRDVDGRQAFRFDKIYLGNAPVSGQHPDEFPSVKSHITEEIIENQLVTEDIGMVRLGLNWEICETDSTVKIAFGDVSVVDNSAAHGGKALRMNNGPEPAYVLAWSQEYLPGEAMVGYVRLMVQDNANDNQILTIEARGNNDVSYAEINVKASDFPAVGTYFEIPVHFVVPSDNKPGLLEFHLKQQTAAIIHFDGISFSTASLTMGQFGEWTTSRPGHRNRGLDIRLVDESGNASSPIQITPILVEEIDSQEENAESGGEVDPVEDEAAEPSDEDAAVDESAPAEADLDLSRSEIVVETMTDSQTTVTHHVEATCHNCAGDGWIVSTTADWLSAARRGNQLEVSVNAAGLPAGSYRASIVVVPESRENTPATGDQLDVILTVNQLFLPVDPVLGTQLARATFLPLTLR